MQLVAGLQVGDQVRIPGDKISGAIENLWKQGMFDDVQIRVTRIQGNIAFLKIVLKERPRMLKFAFTGVKKGEDKKLREEMQIATGDVVTENMLRTSSNKIKAIHRQRLYPCRGDPDHRGGRQLRVASPSLSTSSAARR